MWFARFPGATPDPDDTHGNGITGGFGNASTAAGFYANLLELRRWWDAELANEGMMELSLPTPESTDGAWLANQAKHSIARSMITRVETWHPRMGTMPGFGTDELNGLPDAFTSTATAALEMGAMAYAKGVIDNAFLHYVRDDGTLFHHGEELPQSARMLTVLAAYHGYAGGADAAFMLTHFNRAKALAGLLVARRALTLNLSAADPRHGIPLGGCEAAEYFKARNLDPDWLLEAPPRHYYASAAEAYRGFAEIGAVWQDIGDSSGRADVAAHGAELLKLAPLLYHDLHASLNRTVESTGDPKAPRRWPFVAPAPASVGGRHGPMQTCHELGTCMQAAAPYKAYPEMMWSGALTKQQVDDTYSFMAQNRSLVLGVPGWNASLSLRAPFGLAYGLLQHDFVERFLLHFFAVSAHGSTRGTLTPPQSSNLANRDEPTVTYAATGVHAVPAYLKWMLVFEEPETKTLWLGKAVPRDWLAPGEAPVKVEHATTRYGRLSFSLAVDAAADGSYSVKANISLPSTAKPAGGLRLRVRAPAEHRGKMSGVTVGGKAWPSFDAAAETVDFSAAQLTPELGQSGLPVIIVSFSASKRLKTDDDSTAAADPDPRLLRLLKEICGWIISINVGSNDVYSPGPGGCQSFWCKNFPSYIFVNGNMARVLLAAHTVTGNQTYLDEGLRWCDSFVRVKHTITTSSASPLAAGSNHTTGAWWNTGYGVSLALSLSTLLLILLTYCLLPRAFAMHIRNNLLR